MFLLKKDLFILFLIFVILILFIKYSEKNIISECDTYVENFNNLYGGKIIKSNDKEIKLKQIMSELTTELTIDEQTNILKLFQKQTKNNQKKILEMLLNQNKENQKLILQLLQTYKQDQLNEVMKLLFTQSQEKQKQLTLTLLQDKTILTQLLKQKKDQQNKIIELVLLKQTNKDQIQILQILLKDSYILKQLLKQTKTKQVQIINILLQQYNEDDSIQEKEKHLMQLLLEQTEVLNKIENLVSSHQKIKIVELLQSQSLEQKHEKILKDIELLKELSKNTKLLKNTQLLQLCMIFITNKTSQQSLLYKINEDENENLIKNNLYEMNKYNIDIYFSIYGQILYDTVKPYINNKELMQLLYYSLEKNICYDGSIDYINEDKYIENKLKFYDNIKIINLDISN